MSDFRVTDDIQKFQSLKRVFNWGVIAVDEGEIVCAFNAMAESLTGLPAQRVLGSPIEILPETLRTLLSDSLKAGHPVSGRDIVLHRSPGDDVPINVTTELFRGQHHNGVIAVLAEPLAAEELESHISQLDRLASIGTLSASMAHEIKNALVAVKTFVDLLLRENKNAELAEIVSHEVKRIDSIVSQMLSFAGPAKPTFASVRVHEILQHSFKLIQHQLEGSKTILVQELAAGPDIVKGDRYQLEQVFVNFLFNALEAMGPNGRLTVATDIVTLPPDPTKHQDLTPQLRIIIRDNGVGIAPQDLKRLFDPFFTTKPHGTGLGLSITRRIIQEHHGAIHVESELNHGSAFSIFLPLAARPRSPVLALGLPPS